jgi:hypothetical protein
MNEDFLKDLTEEELKLYDHLIFNYVPAEKIPFSVKKRVVERRKAFAKSMQGQIHLVPGFSFDSDSKIKQY